MGIVENWQLFIQTTKAKSKGHLKAAQYWNSIGTILSLSLIILAAATTFLTLVKSVPSIAVSVIAGLSTILSAIVAFLKPLDKRQIQMEASKDFQELMMKMVRCETEDEYEDLWRDLNKTLVHAPFLPKKFAPDLDIEWTMTPEFKSLARKKRQEDSMEEQRYGNENHNYGAIDMPDDKEEEMRNESKVAEVPLLENKPKAVEMPSRESERLLKKQQFMKARMEEEKQRALKNLWARRAALKKLKEEKRAERALKMRMEMEKEAQPKVVHQSTLRPSPPPPSLACYGPVWSLETFSTEEIDQSFEDAIYQNFENIMTSYDFYQEETGYVIQNGACYYTENYRQDILQNGMRHFY